MATKYIENKFCETVLHKPFLCCLVTREIAMYVDAEASQTFMVAHSFGSMIMKAALNRFPALFGQKNTIMLCRE